MRNLGSPTSRADPSIWLTSCFVRTWAPMACKTEPRRGCGRAGGAGTPCMHAGAGITAAPAGPAAPGSVPLTCTPGAASRCSARRRGQARPEWEGDEAGGEAVSSQPIAAGRVCCCRSAGSRAPHRRLGGGDGALELAAAGHLVADARRQHNEQAHLQGAHMCSGRRSSKLSGSGGSRAGPAARCTDSTALFARPYLVPAADEALRSPVHCFPAGGRGVDCNAHPALARSRLGHGAGRTLGWRCAAGPQRNSTPGCCIARQGWLMA